MLLRPAAPLAAAAALAIFASPARLSGPLLYDDKAAILRNPVVTGLVPLVCMLGLGPWTLALPIRLLTSPAFETPVWTESSVDR